MYRFFYFFLIVLCFTSCKNQTKPNTQDVKNTQLSGPVFGTTYSIIYASEMDYTKQFDSLFTVVNKALSTYIPNSDISKLNRNEDVILDHHFNSVFRTSRIIFAATQGAFDPTIGNVVNAWSFGADKNKFLTDSVTINNLMLDVGFQKVQIAPFRNGFKINKPKETYLEFNAIAKGYGVDVIADFLDAKNVDNYLVEIGGEIRARGKNIEKESPWRVGLDEPRFDGEQSVYKAISLKDEAMATSGTYRKFKVDDQGNRYAHIINTKTGYPSKTNILSVSVIANNCMTADGYATAFQAMGIDRLTRFLEKHPELKVFIVFENNNGEFDSKSFNQFPE
ncbi:FAD:protein FMN transferase [Psychroserpens damuponensis]|uniref:FAD:protein FMN transferase n=1 Tax=Psychroserpens damuponensis TaxID=943936 RepID=UPI0005901266|nr:FAD:protein FMN transferase [Psychroserpens damuponensis]